MTDIGKMPMQADPFQRLLKSRILWLNGEVKDENMADLAAKVMLLSAEDSSRDIYLYINSPGGSVTAGLMFYDVCKLIPNDIVTVSVGMAASMGQFLLTAAGAPGKRFIAPNARVLLHQPHGGFGGLTSDVIGQANLINEMKEQLASITAERTGKTVEQVHKDGDRDRWFNAQEALDYGFVDHIIYSVDDIVKFSSASTISKTTKTTNSSAKDVK